MNKIAILLDIQKQIRNARRVRDLGFIIANKTAGLVPVSNTIFWTYSQGRVVLRSVSGNAVLEVDSPYAQNIKKAISKHLNELSAGQLFHVADITHDAQHVDVTQSTTDNEGQNNSTPPNSNHNPAHSNQTAQSAYNTIMPFMVDEQNIYLDEAQNNDNTNDKPTAKLIGGIWLEHDKPLHDAEEELLKEVSASYGLCLAHLILSAQKNSYLSGNKAKKYKLVLMLIALIAFFFPVRLSVTAPAEIVSAKPFIVSAPFDGILDKVLVSPGDEITPNMIVAQMDKTELQARFDNTEQELNIAQSAYARANLESLRNPERRADLRELQSEINAKRTALEHAELFLSRSDIRAETSGVAIFSDKSSLQDKPIRAG